MKKVILTAAVLFTGLASQGQDLISGGSNSWILHTPDGGSLPHKLHIAPKVNGNWLWSNELEYTSEGVLKVPSKLAIGMGDDNPSGSFAAQTATKMKVVLNKNNASSISFIPNNSDSWFHFGHGLNNSLELSQGPNPGDIKLMTFKNTGYIGIGTQNPDQLLTVKGKIHSEEVIVDLSVPADYVFEKYYEGTSELKEDYKMPSLEEVEAFTKKNHHLPSVPSAATIQKEGLQLKEMTNLLLQKIEELTLYTIEQEKRIKALEKKLAEKK
jgi:hypothetical protein